jgi:hypothetical protein
MNDRDRDTGLAKGVVNIKSAQGSIASWFAIILGVVIIGLLGMFHLHCVACDTGEAGHDHGHAHR